MSVMTENRLRCQEVFYTNCERVGGEPVLVPLTSHSLRGLPCQGGFVGLRRVSSGGRRASVQTGAVALKVGERAAA